jgi:hypothetical protein
MEEYDSKQNASIGISTEGRYIIDWNKTNPYNDYQYPLYIVDKNGNQIFREWITKEQHEKKMQKANYELSKQLDHRLSHSAIPMPISPIGLQPNEFVPIEEKVLDMGKISPLLAKPKDEEEMDWETMIEKVQKRYVCKMCGMNYNGQSGLWYHMRNTHQKGYQIKKTANKKTAKKKTAKKKTAKKKTAKKKTVKNTSTRVGGGGCFSTPKGNNEENEEKYYERALKELELKDFYEKFLLANGPDNGNIINVTTQTWGNNTCIIWPKTNIDLTEEQKSLQKYIAMINVTNITRRFGSTPLRTPTPPGNFRPIRKSPTPNHGGKRKTKRRKKGRKKTHKKKNRKKKNRKKKHKKTRKKS